MPVRLGVPALLLERAAERVMGVVVGGRELEHGAELGLRLGPALDPEVRDAERLADRRLVRLEPLRLLERDGRLGGHAVPEMLATLLEEVVRVAHSMAFRYGKFSSSRSSGRVRSRVGPIGTATTSSAASIAA